MHSEEAIAVIDHEMDWLESVIDQAIRTYLVQEGGEHNWTEIPLPELEPAESAYAQKVKDWNTGISGRLALALAMAPHIRPQALDVFFGKNQMYDRGFTEFGGVTSKSHNGFLPTGQTLSFLLSTGKPEWKAETMNVLGRESILVKEQVLQVEETEPYLPWLSGILGISPRWVHFFLTGEELPEEHSASFPAQRIETSMTWEDVVLDNIVMNQVNEISVWLKHSHTLMSDWGLAKMLKPGYRALFYGPPGTGKTLTATLIGKTSGRDVYKVDLSMIVSKYIGETEKNLSKLFDAAQHRHWILFFDEADALFGKRTAASSSNDHHSNQQIAYLLQRIEDFPGVVILASNLKANIDEAFARRFQSMIHFSMPGTEERYRLWQLAFSGGCTLHPGIDIYSIAEKYELAGGAIINVLRYCALCAVQRGDAVTTEAELLSGIRKELKKENKTVSIVR